MTTTTKAITSMKPRPVELPANLPNVEVTVGRNAVTAQPYAPLLTTPALTLEINGD